VLAHPVPSTAFTGPHGWYGGGGAPWSFHKVLDSDDRESCRLQRNFLKIYSGNEDSWKAQQLWKKVLARWT